MGNGQFGLHIVETPKVDRAIGTPSVPVEYESVLFKKEYFPHVTTSTYNSPIKGTLPLDYSNRPFSTLPHDGTLGGGCSGSSQIPYLSAHTMGQKYESSSTSTHSSFLSSCCTGNSGSPVNSSWPVSRKTTTSGFPEIRHLGQRYNPYYKKVADDFHLRYKENYSNSPTKSLQSPEKNDNMQHTPSSYEVNVENMVNNNVIGKMSSFDFIPPACCEQYTTTPMVKMLHGTEAGRLIASVCGGGSPGNSPYNDAGRRYESENKGRPVSKGAQTTPPEHLTPPGYGFKTKESQTPRLSNVGQKNPKGNGGNGNRIPKKSDNGHNGDNDGDRWIDDPYVHGKDENVPTSEKVPADNDKNVKDNPKTKGDNSGNGNDRKKNKSPTGAGGHGTKVPNGKLYPEGVPNWINGGDPMGNGDVNKKDSPTKTTAPPKPTKPPNKPMVHKPVGTVVGNIKKKKSQPRLKKISPIVENGIQNENKEKQPSTDSEPKKDPENEQNIPDTPALADKLYPTWSDGHITQHAPPEPSKPSKPRAKTSLPTPVNKPRASDSDKRRKTDPTPVRSSIPVLKPAGPRQSVPVLKADRQSLARLKEILSRSFSAGPAPGRRHSDPIPESADDKRRLSKNKKAKSAPDLKLDNLPLTPTVDLSILNGGRKSRRRSSTDDPPPPPPTRSSAPSWFTLMPSTSADAEEKSESSHPRKHASVNFTGSNKPQPKKSSLKKSISKHGPGPLRASSSTASSRSSKSPIGRAKPNHQNAATKKKSIRFTGVPPTP